MTATATATPTAATTAPSSSTPTPTPTAAWGLSTPFREAIQRCEAALATVPGVFFGDSPLCPLRHSFADGIYVREMFIPAGVVIIGKIHKHAHPNFLLQGAVIVVTEAGGWEHLVAPLSIISPPGTKRAVLALTDTVWITVHTNPTETQDRVELEAHVIAPTYDAYTAYRATLPAPQGARP